MLGAVSCVVAPSPAEAQAGPVTEAPQGLFPGAILDAEFRKYTPPRNVFSPYYSWDAHLAMDVTVVRKGRGALAFSSLFQSAGTENIHNRVTVGGTGYLLGLRFVHTRSKTFELSSGLSHFSSHLTRDLDEKTAEERGRGVPIPHGDDPSEYNVLYVSGRWTLAERPLAPELELGIQPINFRFNGRDADYVRPIYLASRWTLWRGERKAVRAETVQEIGRRPFITAALVLALRPRGEAEGPFQAFVSATPGGKIRVSPRTGSVRGGIACGIRMRFRT